MFTTPLVRNHSLLGNFHIIGTIYGVFNIRVMGFLVNKKTNQLAIIIMPTSHDPNINHQGSACAKPSKLIIIPHGPGQRACHPSWGSLFLECQSCAWGTCFWHAKTRVNSQENGEFLRGIPGLGNCPILGIGFSHHFPVFVLEVISLYPQYLRVMGKNNVGIAMS